MENLRFGLIGFGRFGTNHARAIAATDGAELAAVATRTEESAEAARELFPEAAVYTDYREMLEREEIDIVDVAVPTYLHFECGKAALESGRHLFIEKPMAPTLAKCRELNQIAAGRDLRVAVGFKRRVAHLWSRVKSLDLPPPTDELFELSAEMASMVRAVKEGTPIFANGIDGAWSIGICEAAHQSIESGEVISLKGLAAKI